MLPAHIAENIRRQVLFYLQSTFDFRDPEVEKAFRRFLTDPDSGLFKGPWVQLRRPFRPAGENAKIPFDIRVPFHPFLHQWRAWRRLSSRGRTPEPTIVTTGTGSGKTECFLYPILDHCLRARRRGEKGIKAIVLYPMNALASDQEKRFARVVHDDPSLRAASIRVGNYTGRYDPADPGAAVGSGTKAMGKDHGISNHEAQQEDPPDILLTNYKMLDFLLLRPQDQRLWRHNAPGVLRYLVLDELHTYDGAQGADVACLVRRLKERLDIPRGELCVVGTSATLDDREALEGHAGARKGGAADAAETGNDRLARFASTLFEEEIPVEAVVGEDRLTVEEIVHCEPREVELPPAAECRPREDEDALGYASRQALLWGGPGLEVPAGADEEGKERAIEAWSVALGEWLRRSFPFRYLLDIFRRCEEGREGPLSWRDLVDRMARLELGFSAIPRWEERSIVVASFFALVAQAREERSGHAFPLVPTQVQLWLRELRRLGRLVDEAPAFTWLDEPVPGRTSLPTFHCSECGESGWVALHEPAGDTPIQARGVDGTQLSSDPGKIYRAWFGPRDEHGQHIVVLSPWREESAKDGEALPEQRTFAFEHQYLCPASLVLRRDDGPCPITGDSRRFRVKVNRKTRTTDGGRVVGVQGCPACDSRESVLFIGSQSATLSSVALDEMFGSRLNSDPKLLAFTDSVQDASHRAGFFTARTYHFTFRTALQRVIDDAGPGGVPLVETGRRLLDWSSADSPGRPGDPREALATLMPPDLQEYEEFVAYRNDAVARDPPKKLREEIEERLAWQATSEFGLMETHGRSLEACGGSTLGWDEEIVAGTLRELRAGLPGLDPLLESIEDDAFRLWLLGFLHRYRLRGALAHPYLVPLARQGFWGKSPFGRAVAGREAHPPQGRFRPRLLVTGPAAHHENVLAATKGNLSPWNVVWARRALGGRTLDETSILDLIRLLLRVGNAAGIFRKLHQDGTKEYHAVSAAAATLRPDGVHLVCSESGRSLVRPAEEAHLWIGAPSVEYYARRGRYERKDFTPRQRYYQDRYRKGALRRVVAHEHTGLLATEEREEVERTFVRALHRDDPNVLTCTSTLEMGIDVGDLSSTMLCSIPPNTASFLQRIGRAGRATGTALIVSVVNQRPHDLFFYARPAEMIRGRVDPPGCWLDASAVLVRQYLAYCLDSATKTGELTELPRSGRQLVEDLERPEGHIARALAWVTRNEDDLRQTFLQRFRGHLQEDTRDRFLSETSTDLLLQRVHHAAGEFDRQRRDLENARKRLQTQLKALDAEEKDARLEIERELHILRGRTSSLGRTNALEILTDHGLLPNYAFPERGVRFYGAVYNRHRRARQEHKPVEVVRAAGSALKELAPANHFYTHGRCFEIQQIAVGNPQQPIVDELAVCGACGHLRSTDDLGKPGTSPSCPQCGHDSDRHSQADRGQQRKFIQFSRSQALSYMDHYESLSADRSDERKREFYHTISTFDLTVDAPSGAVGNDDLPFGIEYRASTILREINVGYAGLPKVVPFGPNESAPEEGFLLCRDCGVAVPPARRPDHKLHRRSCSARRRHEKLKQEGKAGDPFKWLSVYLYRELRSEAIRLLLPVADEEDIDTLVACIYLGLRLRFEGNPGHLIARPQVMPESASGQMRHYLVLLDAVPGGTGYLKTLYQEKDGQGRAGEGILDVLRRARSALETCPCRKLKPEDDTDGCYRCVRTYHLQYNAERISRERGIRLLGDLIGAGEKRVAKKELAEIKPHSLFASMLEKKFIDALRAFVEEKSGTWEKTIIKGARGFRFSLMGSSHLWEVELQPSMGPAQGVNVQSRPDFLLRCDDEAIRPLAVFTDGFEFHCHPNNRLADDLRKRRSIVESGQFHVWSITWHDLAEEGSDHNMVCHPKLASVLQEYASSAKSSGLRVPSARLVLRNGMEQLKAFLESPHAGGWAELASFSLFWPLQVLADKRRVLAGPLEKAVGAWRSGGGLPRVDHVEGGDLVYNDRVSLNQDLVSYTRHEDVLSNRRSQAICLARLGDSEAECSGSDYPERWRRFLACVNFYQFCDHFRFLAASEAAREVPEVPLAPSAAASAEWQEIAENVAPSLRGLVNELCAPGLPEGVPLPATEHYNESIDDDAFAELAWPGLSPPVAVLAGEQADFSEAWQKLGWKIVVASELQARGVEYLVDLLAKSVHGG